MSSSRDSGVPEESPTDLHLGEEVHSDEPLLDGVLPKSPPRRRFPLPAISVSPPGVTKPAAETATANAVPSTSTAPSARSRQLSARSNSAPRRSRSPPNSRPTSSTLSVPPDREAQRQTSTRERLAIMQQHNQLVQLRNTSSDFLEQLHMLCSHNETVRPFLKVYKKLHSLFCTSLDNRERLSLNIEKLRTEAAQIGRQVRKERETASLEEQSVAALEKEATQRRGQIREIKEEMRLTQTEIAQLNQDVECLVVVVSDELERNAQEFGAREDAARRYLMENVMTHKTTLERLVRELGDEESDLQHIHDRAKKDRDRAAAEVEALRNRLRAIEVSVETEQARIVDAREELQERKEESNQMAASNRQLEATLNHSKRELTELQNSVKEHRDLLRSKQAELEARREEERRQKALRDRCVKNTSNLETQHEQLRREINEINAGIDRFRRKATRAELRKQRLLNRRERILRRRDESVSEKDRAKAETERVRRECDQTRVACDFVSSEIDHHDKARLALQKDLSKQARTTGELQEELNSLATQERNILQTIATSRREAEQSRREIYILEDRVSSFRNQVADITDNCESVENQKNVLLSQREDLDADIMTLTNQLKSDHGKLEELRNERNLLRNRLVKIEVKTREQTNRYAILSAQIKSIKNDITSRERQRAEQATESVRRSEEISNVRSIKEKVETCTARQRRETRAISKRIEQFHHLIAEAKENRNRQQREVLLLINERDILGNRLLSQNEELSGLYNEMKVNQKKINSGKREFEERSEELTLLQSRVGALQARIDEINAVLEFSDPLRREVNLLRDQLLQEKMKLTVLVEESNICLNVHGYRMLENTNPQLLGVVREVSSTQRSLCSVQEEIHRIDASIKEKELLYRELKKTMARQPTHASVAGEMKIVRSNLVKKRRQIAVLERDLVAIRKEVGSEQHLHGFLAGEYQKVSTLYRERYEGNGIGLPVPNSIPPLEV